MAHLAADAGLPAGASLSASAAARARPAATPIDWRERLARLRYRWWPDHWIGEILAKRWTETAVPVLLLVLVVLASGALVPNFYSATMMADSLRQAGEVGFVVLGLALVMIVGGIDLSVGSMFALANFCALLCMHVLKWPVGVSVLVTLVAGAATSC